MSTREQRRAEVVVLLSHGGLTVGQASLLLGVGERQVRRLRDAYRRLGLSAMAHGNRGRPAANRTGASVRERLKELAGAGAPYHDMNTCHLSDLLEEQHGIVLGRSTLDRLLKEEGLREARRKGPVTRRSRREPCPASGQMLQVDGSPHAWLEERGPTICLMGAIDDATGTLVYGRFHETEDQKGYLMLLRGVCTTRGIPMSVYHDKHTILRSPKEPTLEEQLEGKKPMSQIQRVMDELGIESIPAHSPQAKGRVERLWKTLQDRLVKEMRLAGITTIEGANAFLDGFLPRFNARFARAPSDPEDAFVPLPKDADLDRLFSVRESRVVREDHTLSFHGQTFLLLPSERTSLARKRVAVHVTPEGKTLVYDGQTALPYRGLGSNTTRTPSPKAAGTAQPAQADLGDGVRSDGPGGPHTPPALLKGRPLWGRRFEVSHAGPCPAKDLAFYNKLSASGGQIP